MVGGSQIGGMKKTQEMLELCAKHNIVADIELIKMSDINSAMDRLAKSNVRYRDRCGQLLESCLSQLNLKDMSIMSRVCFLCLFLCLFSTSWCSYDVMNKSRDSENFLKIVTKLYEPIFLVKLIILSFNILFLGYV